MTGPALAAGMDRGGRGYRLLQVIVSTLLRGPWGLRLDGAERLPVSAPYILAPNHPSEIDPIVLSAALPFRPRFVASRHLEEFSVLFVMMRLFDPVLVRRGLNDVSAVRACLERLRHNDVLVVFPEGRVVQDAPLGPLHPGAAFLAVRAQVPIVPVALVGTAAMWPLGARWPRRSRLLIRVGSPIAPPATVAQVGALTQAVERGLRALLAL